MRTIDLPALHATHAGIWIAAGGEVREASRSEAIKRLAETPHVLLNAPLVGQRLGTAEVSGLDLLELFAFVHPARFAVPTVAGMCCAVGTGRTIHARFTALVRSLATAGQVRGRG